MPWGTLDRSRSPSERSSPRARRGRARRSRSTAPASRAARRCARSSRRARRSISIALALALSARRDGARRAVRAHGDGARRRHRVRPRPADHGRSTRTRRSPPLRARPSWSCASSASARRSRSRCCAAPGTRRSTRSRRAVLGRIVNDEAAHGTFGFTFLDWALPASRATKALALARSRRGPARSLHRRTSGTALRRDAARRGHAGDALGWMRTDAYLALAEKSLDGQSPRAAPRARRSALGVTISRRRLSCRTRRSRSALCSPRGVVSARAARASASAPAFG